MTSGQLEVVGKRKIESLPGENQRFGHNLCTGDAKENRYLWLRSVTKSASSFQLQTRHSGNHLVFKAGAEISFCSGKATGVVSDHRHS